MNVVAQNNYTLSGRIAEFGHLPSDAGSPAKAANRSCYQVELKEMACHATAVVEDIDLECIDEIISRVK